MTVNGYGDVAASEFADLYEGINRAFDVMEQICNERDEAIQRAEKAEAALARALAAPQESASK